MIATYSEYLRRFLLPECLDGHPCPGEHHFVCVYLIPLLFEINRRVPDYINPDGTKGIIGDVTYYEDGEHQFGIEVKLGTVRLTKGEFNAWIVEENESLWPHLYVGIGLTGISVCSWRDFRSAYISAVREKHGEAWKPKQLDSGYGPTKNVDVLSGFFRDNQHFSYQAEQKKAVEYEKKFRDALRTGLNHKPDAVVDT